MNFEHTTGAGSVFLLEYSDGLHIQTSFPLHKGQDTNSENPSENPPLAKYTVLNYNYQLSNMRQ